MTSHWSSQDADRDHPQPPRSRPGTTGSGGRTALALLAGLLTFVLICGAEVTLVGALVGWFGGDGRQSAADDAQWATPATSPTPPVAPVPSASAVEGSGPASGDVETKQVTETTRIPFPVQTVEDPSLAAGQHVVRTRGVTGVKTLTYEVTYADGEPTAKRLVRSVVTRQPVAQVVAVGVQAAAECDPNYSGCVPVAEDVDCAGRGNGPAWVNGTVKVTGSDVYRLDRDRNGVACDEDD